MVMKKVDKKVNRAAYTKRSKVNAGFRKTSLLSKMLQRFPSWSWWIGGIAVVVLYIWIFYSFFVSPTGFRWRALYGDPN